MLGSNGGMRMSDDTKFFIPVLLGTSRIGRQSIHIAQLVLQSLAMRPDVTTDLIDLAEYVFPIMQERLDEMVCQPHRLQEFSQKLNNIDGLVIVAPEYKNSYPGALKNAFDYLKAGILRRKPVGIATVSSGGCGGVNCLAQLRLVCLAMGGVPIPASLSVAKVHEIVNSSGNLCDEKVAAQCKQFLDELIWYTSAMTCWRRADSGPRNA